MISSTTLFFAILAEIVPAFASSAFLLNLTSETLFTHPAKSVKSLDEFQLAPSPYVLSASAMNLPVSSNTLTASSEVVSSISKYPTKSYPGLVGVMISATAIPIAYSNAVVPSFASAAFLLNVTLDVLLTHLALSVMSKLEAQLALSPYVLASSLTNDPSASNTLISLSSKYPTNEYPALVGIIISYTFSPVGITSDVVPGFASAEFLSNTTFDEFFFHAAKSVKSLSEFHFLSFPYVFDSLSINLPSLSNT